MTLSTYDGHYERLAYRRQNILKYMPDGNKRLFHAALLAMYHDSVWNDPSLKIHAAENLEPLLKITISI